MSTVAALFVETGGRYFGLDSVDPWDIERDARTYGGPHPVVAHPPCFLWVNLAAVNWKRYGKDRPAWYPGGSDGGCFASALAAVRRWGGVLEHPAGSWAWKHFDLKRPTAIGWQRCTPWESDEFVCEVWQSAYGHAARKRTWLFYKGAHPPRALDWSRERGTHQIGWFDRKRPTLSKRAAMATPAAFADVLIGLARDSSRDLGIRRVTLPPPPCLACGQPGHAADRCPDVERLRR